VIRMVFAVTLVMVIVMTFRIPGAALAGYYSLLLTRENLVATWRQAVTIVLGFVAGTLYVLLGMMLFRGYSTTHFFWVVGTLYLVFFIMRTATNYGAAAGFSFLIATTLSIWDQPLTSEDQVANTLWQTAAIAVGVGFTVATEAVYHLFDRSDPLITSIDDLLSTAQQVMENIADRRTVPEVLSEKVLQYEITGTGRLRTSLVRQGVDASRRAHLSALISLTGRVVELAADLERARPVPSEEDARRLRTVSEKLEGIRRVFRESGVIDTAAVLAGQPSPIVPILPEIERTVGLIVDVFHRGESTDDSRHESEVPSRHGLFVPDVFQNLEYQRFALAGCLAATLCYVLYNALDWPGISTSVLTCIVTALSTIGASVQKQVLRLSGYVVGGLIIGIPAQILILPNIDTIFEFALFFAAGTAVAAWFATSSPRLSYFGLQIALAFYFINLLDFHVQTDLTVARDRVIGVLFGILAMGFIFDRFGPRSDAEQTRKLFTQILRMLARLGFSSIQRDTDKDFPEIQRLRSQINDSFTSLASQMESVQFERGYGPSHQQDVVDRETSRRAQLAMRSIYVLELSLLQYRGLTKIEHALTRQQKEALNRFLNEYSASLLHIAAITEHGPRAPRSSTDDSALRVLQALHDKALPYSPVVLYICEQMVASLNSLRDTYISS
jgi:multidrug resistance protein MdtO